jgi:hypothetical protein
MLLYRVCFKAGRLPALTEQNLKYQALEVLVTRVHQSWGDSSQGWAPVTSLSKHEIWRSEIPRETFPRALVTKV